MDRSSRRCGRCEGRAWPVLGAVAGAGGSSDGPRVRIRPPACCAARHRCSQRRCARHSSWLDRRLPPSRAWSRPSQRTCARPPDPPTRRRSPLLRPGVVASSCSSAADQPPDVQLRRRAVASPDRVASAALDRDLQLDGAMSSPGPAAKLALKRQTGLMGGDMGLAATTAAAQAQRSTSAAQPVAAVAAAAAAATGAYDMQAMARASQSLPVVPARSSTTGRPAAPPHPYFVAGRDRGRGRGRGSPQQWCSQQRCRRRRRQRQRRRWPQQPQ